jgi:hypothetical protein
MAGPGYRDQSGSIAPVTLLSWGHIWGHMRALHLSKSSNGKA